MQDELKPIVSALGFEPHGEQWMLCRDDTEWFAVVFGLGKSGVDRGLRSAIEIVQPNRVILIGFSGALDPAMKVGELVNVEHVVRYTDGHDFLLINKNKPPQTLGEGGRYEGDASLWTVEQPVVTQADKAGMRDQGSIPLVDMESSFAAALCVRCELPLRIWRAVSDTAGESIPAGLIDSLRPNGTVDVMRAVRFLALRPWHWRRAMRLRKNAQRAAASLIEAIRREMSLKDDRV